MNIRRVGLLPPRSMFVYSSCYIPNDSLIDPDEEIVSDMDSNSTMISVVRSLTPGVFRNRASDYRFPNLENLYSRFYNICLAFNSSVGNFLYGNSQDKKEDELLEIALFTLRLILKHRSDWGLMSLRVTFEQIVYENEFDSVFMHQWLCVESRSDVESALKKDRVLHRLCDLSFNTGTGESIRECARYRKNEEEKFEYVLDVLFSALKVDGMWMGWWRTITGGVTMNSVYERLLLSDGYFNKNHFHHSLVGSVYEAENSIFTLMWNIMFVEDFDVNYNLSVVRLLNTYLKEYNLNNLIIRSPEYVDTFQDTCQLNEYERELERLFEVCGVMGFSDVFLNVRILNQLRCSTVGVYFERAGFYSLLLYIIGLMKYVFLVFEEVEDSIMKRVKYEMSKYRNDILHSMRYVQNLIDNDTGDCIYELFREMEENNAPDCVDKRLFEELAPLVDADRRRWSAAFVPVILELLHVHHLDKPILQAIVKDVAGEFAFSYFL